MKTYIKQMGLFAIAIVATIGVSYAGAVIGWSGPASAPPGGNVGAPLNISSSTQTKLGSLILNAATPLQSAIGLAVFGTSVFNGKVQVADGSQGAGKVLTSDASGTATWITPACSAATAQNYTLPVSDNSGNNASVIKTLLLLQPGTYTFSGGGTTVDENWGGGIASVFLSPTLYTSGSPLPSEIVSYDGVTGGTGSQYINHYGNGDPIIWALTRNGNNDGTWTIPSGTTVTVSQPEYVYSLVSQAVDNGYVYVTGTAGGSTGGSGCGGGGSQDIRSGTSTGVVETPITVTFSSQMPNTRYAVMTNFNGSLPSRAGENAFITNKTISGFTYEIEEGFNSSYDGTTHTIDWMAVPYQ